MTVEVSLLGMQTKIPEMIRFSMERRQSYSTLNHHNSEETTVVNTHHSRHRKNKMHIAQSTKRSSQQKCLLLFSEHVISRFHQEPQHIFHRSL